MTGTWRHRSRPTSAALRGRSSAPRIFCARRSCWSRRVPDQGGGAAERVAVAGQDQLAAIVRRARAQRGHVLEQRARPLRRRREPRRVGRADRRVGDRVGGDPLEQVIAGDQDAVAREHRVGRAVARPLAHVPRAPAGDELVAVGQDPGHRHVAEEAAERPADALQRLDGRLRHAVPAHERDGVGVVRIHARVDVGHERGERRRPGDVGARAPSQLAGEADVVGVLVGQEDQLEVLDGEAERGEARVEPRLRLLHQRAGVDQRQRLAAQQPGTDVPDLERRGQRDVVDALGQHARHPTASAGRFFADSQVPSRSRLAAAAMVLHA